MRSQGREAILGEDFAIAGGDEWADGEVFEGVKLHFAGSERDH